MKTTKEKEQVLALRAQSYSIAKISQETGLAKETITNILRENREQVLSLSTMEEDIILREKKLTRQARLESFGILLSNIREELATRSLKEVPTEKLYKMYLDTQKAVREETEDLRGLYSPEEAEADRQEREEDAWKWH